MSLEAKTAFIEHLGERCFWRLGGFWRLRGSANSRHRHRPNRPIVMMGHRDTVFPDGTAAQRPFRIDGDQAFGPGVAWSIGEYRLGRLR
jgi:hypothetical protein